MACADAAYTISVSFAAGFFGVRYYQSSYELVVEIEGEPFNSTLAPWENCLPNGDTFYNLGNEATDAWTAVYLKDAIQRLQPYITGLNLTAANVFGMQNLCAFETVSLGYSEFCGLFTETEWEGFEYAVGTKRSGKYGTITLITVLTDTNFWYADGPGNPVTSAQGIGYVKELVARLTNTPITTFDASLNATYDGNNVTFPLQQPM